jgi:hypothetical protein
MIRGKMRWVFWAFRSILHSFSGISVNIEGTRMQEFII